MKLQFQSETHKIPCGVLNLLNYMSHDKPIEC